MQAQQQVTKILREKLAWHPISEGVDSLGAEVLRTIGTTGLFTLAAESGGNPARPQKTKRGESEQ